VLFNQDGGLILTTVDPKARRHRFVTNGPSQHPPAVALASPRKLLTMPRQTSLEMPNAKLDQ
jgi:hypothetical protein